MTTLIFLNVLAFAFETVDSISVPNKSYFNDFETFSVVIFTLEYVLRLWTCTLDQRFRHPIIGRLKFAATPLSIVDFISILPYYLFLIFPNLVFIRELHLLRLARLLKIGRYSESLRTIGYVIRTKWDDLFTALITAIILLMISSSVVYFAEHAAQPELFPNIPASMWWSVITLTSVGYGDVYPVTPLGKLIGGIIAVSGLGLVALPAGIIASGFTEEFERKRKIQGLIASGFAREVTTQADSQKTCPHCGREIDQQPHR